jgi:hypothetical protein
MSRRALIGALALVAVGVVLGATVFREDIALAAQAVSAEIIGPLDVSLETSNTSFRLTSAF